MTNQQTNSNSGSVGQQTLLSFGAIRDTIIRELRAESLLPAEQDKLIQEVGEALIERATLALMKSAPPELIVEFSEDGKDPRDPANANSFMQRIMQDVPDAQEVVANEIKAGLLDYQEYLDKELAKNSTK